MPRFAVLLALMLTSSVALAGEVKVRALDGTVVRIDEEAHTEPTLVVAFSVSDPEAPARIKTVKAYASPLALRVLLISTDPAQERIAVKRWARTHGSGFPVFHDPDGNLVRKGNPQTVLLSAKGDQVHTWGPWDERVAGEVSAGLAKLPGAPQSPTIGSISVEDMPLLEVENGPPTPTAD